MSVNAEQLSKPENPGRLILNNTSEISQLWGYQANLH